MKELSMQTLINWKSINPENSDYEVPLLKNNRTLDEQSDWFDTHNHFNSELLLLLVVNVLGEQQVTMGYYYEHEYSVYDNAKGLPNVMLKRKYFSDLRYTIHCHEVENVIGWCYHKDSVSDVEQTSNCVVN